MEFIQEIAPHAQKIQEKYNILASLVIANIAKVDDPSQIEGALEIIVSGIFGLLAAIGVYRSHDKNNDNAND